MALDSSGDPNSRRQTILWEKHGGPNQQWIFYPAQNGAYFIVNCQDQGTLEIPNQHPQPGAELHSSQPNRTPNEMWLITPHGEGVMIRSVLNDRMGLNICGGQLNNGARIILYELTGTPNEIWDLLPVN